MATKYILMGGGMYSEGNHAQLFFVELIQNNKRKPIKILDCLFTRPKASRNKQYQINEKFFSKHLDNIEYMRANSQDFREQTKKADIIVFQGGYVTQGIAALQDHKNWLQGLDDKVIVGISGGASALCKYYAVGKTERIGEGLGILPIKFIPHWGSQYKGKYKPNRKGLYKNLKNYKEDLPMHTVAEGEFIIL